MKYDKMLEKQQEIIKKKKTITLETIDNMFFAGEKLSIRSIASRAEVSTDFIYNHEEIINRIKHLKNLPPDAKNKERVIKMFVDNKELMDRIEKISDTLINTLVRNNTEL